MGTPSIATLPRLRSVTPARDLEGFFLSVQEAQNDFLDRFNVAQDARPLFVEEWPLERLAEKGKPFDFIGFHVAISRRASESNTEYRPANGLKLVEQQPSTTESGYINETFGWNEEGVLQFTIFSQSNKRASAVMSWLRALILKYAHDGFFRSRGFNLVVFHNRLEDTIEKTQSQDLYTRRIQFRVRSQNPFDLQSKTIETFRIDLGLNDGTSVISRTLSVDE